MGRVCSCYQELCPKYLEMAFEMCAEVLHKVFLVPFVWLNKGGYLHKHDQSH
jgi:hypothetical protein